MLITWFDDTRRPMPTGINANPIIKKVGKTVPAVRIGCHAGSFCCLKALPNKRKKCIHNKEKNILLVLKDWFTWLGASLKSSLPVA